MSSPSQWRTSRAKLRSDAICVWAGVYSFSGAQRVEMPEHTESEGGVQFRFGQVHAKQSTAQLARKKTWEVSPRTWRQHFTSAKQNFSILASWLVSGALMLVESRQLVHELWPGESS